MEVNIVAVANSTKMLFDEDGLELQSCISKMKAQVTHGYEVILRQMSALNLPNSIFVDCTSSPEVTSFYGVFLPQYFYRDTQQEGELLVDGRL